MKFKLKSQHGIFLAIIMLVLAVIYLGYNQYQDGKRLGDLKQEFVQKTAGLDEKINNLNDGISDVRDQNKTLSGALQDEGSRSTSVEEQIGKVADTVSTINKLQTIDPQLLQKYSKIYFLNEHYVPAELADIKPQYIFDKNRTIQLETHVLPFLEGLLKASASDGVSLQILSGYRSFGTQSALKTSYKFTYGAGTANQFSADQGYSEHQLGTAVDFTTPKIGDTFAGFDASPEYTWLLAHAHEYGFILSYPKNNAYYAFEPWHWRFVGVDLATKLHRDNKYFYDLPQREINDYLLVLFD